jgi:hypothetical protein
LDLMCGVAGEGAVVEIEGRRYRRRLERRWNEADDPRTILWIGMNPSTADAQIDDNTCRREQKISMRYGFNKYLKGNILDLMETNSRLIPRDVAIARTPENLIEIHWLVAEADWIVLAHGNLPPAFQESINDIYRIIRASRKPVAVFQYNGDQVPTHTRGILNASIPEVLEAVRRHI